MLWQEIFFKLRGRFEDQKPQTLSTGFVSDRDLMKWRYKKYLELISQLDTQNLSSKKGMEELMTAIQEEFTVD